MPIIAGKEVGPVAFGLMGLVLPPAMAKDGRVMPDEEIFEILRQSLEHGANLWNGGEFYGTPERNSLTMLKSYFEKYPEDADKVVLSIKGCIVGPQREPRCDAASVRKSVENCARMLGDKKRIDIFEPARIDKNVPVEETFGELVKLRDEGVIGAISISEAGPESLRRAAKVTKLEFLETEVSIFEDNVWKEGIAEAAAELNIPILAYSPLGRGWLTGSIKTPEDVKGIQKMSPRFSDSSFQNNKELADKVKQAAESQGVTPAQFSIAWVMSRTELPGSPTFLPLPGASSKGRLAENLGSKQLPLSAFEQIDKYRETFTVAGTRYPEHALKHLNG